MRKYYSPLIGAALAAASLFHFSLPAFAAGTSAGQDLVNKATATYSDADENTYDATSNEVTVTVGKVAGITNVAIGNDSTGPILAGQELGFDFRVTNTGNDASSIFIPDTTTIGNYAGTTDNLTVDSVEYSTDDGETFTARPDDGIVPNVAEDDFIIVRVNVTIDGSAADSTDIAVQLGNTGENDDSVDTQNQPDEIAGSPDTASDDVRTVTADAAATTVDTDPINGQREASAVNTTQVNAVPIALPRITKVSDGVDQSGTPLDVSDDIVTYNLDLDVLNDGLPEYTSPNFNFSFEGLEGRDYSTATSTDPGAASDTPVFDDAEFGDRSNLILISDAIPAGTELNTADSGGVTSAVGVEAPDGWAPVYTDSPLTVPADEAVWRADLDDADIDGTITRIGWIYDASSDSNGVIAQGRNFTGFSFEVVTTGITGTTDIYNLAQVFGTTDDGDDDDTDGDGTTTGAIVFDESGDRNPSNFNDDGNGRTDETVVTANIDDGEGNTIAVYGYDPAPPEANIDPGSNTGTGPAGEFNEVTVTLDAVTTSDILNGPGAYDRPGDTPDIVAAPDALGTLFGVDPADDNHDFQNLSVGTPSATDLAADASFDDDGNVIETYDPDAKVFNNSVLNDGEAQIDVVLEPISPGYDGLGGTDDDLPINTRVLIQFGSQAAEYVYDGTTFNQEAAGTSEIDNSITISDDPVTITNLPVDGSEDYTVTVDLPDNTELSTSYDGGVPADGLVGGYPVPIVAYVDTGDDGLTLTSVGTDTAGDDSFNITINQLYTGFLQLEKTATIFGLTDPTDPDSTVDEVTRDPIPGDIIQYDITYTNISEAETSGESGNILLTIDDMVITEDGQDTVTGNNWALDNDTDGIIDTLHVEGEATEIDPLTEAAPDSPATILYTSDSGAEGTSDTALTGEIVRYEFGGTNGVDGIAPGESGIFRFQRQVTEDNDSDSDS